jgi:hypothetical protein
MTIQSEDKIAYLIVRNKEYANESALLDPNSALCSFCQREKGDHDLLVSGHTISVCSECLASLNTPDLDQSVVSQN